MNKNGIIGASNPEVVVDHESDLSSTKKQILFGCFLFLQTDLLLEVGILDDLIQSRNNSRVQRFKILEILTLELSAMILNRPLIDHLHFLNQ